MIKKILIPVFFLAAMLAASGAASAEENAKSPWERKFDQERAWRAEGLTLIPYRSNYIFPVSYNTSPHATSNQRAQNKEAKFQLSFKVLLMENILDYDAHLYFGYTQLSMWQLYDRAKSSPFRDTDYEPEAILTLDSVRPLGPVMLRQTDIGLSHESNGTSDPDSRSWNRVYARFHFDVENLGFTIRPWWRIPEPESKDDNKHIERYRGYGEVTAAYFIKNHIFSIMLRNNLRSSGNKGAVELDYSFPLTGILTGLVQYFNGYGECLVDFDRPTNRVSLGIALSNWH